MTPSPNSMVDTTLNSNLRLQSTKNNRKQRQETVEDAGRLVRVMVAHGAPHVSVVQSGTERLGSRVARVDDAGDVAH